jgi:hypothetical protein
VFAAAASASLCVWRQPDSDIKAVFGAGTYKTVFVDITDTQRARIEKRLGFALDADETQFKFFPVFKSGKPVGTVMTHAGKGQFGAIEVVVSVVPTDSVPVVRDVRIQRDREKSKAALRSAGFLDQFKGRTARSGFAVPGDLKPAAPEAVKASRSVAEAVRKLLVVYDELGIGRTEAGK